MGSSSSHISGGHWNEARPRGRGQDAKFLTSTGMLPPPVPVQGVSTLGLNPRHGSREPELMRRPARHCRTPGAPPAGSTASLKAKGAWTKNFGAPTHPTVAPSREGRWHLKSRVERGLPSKAEAGHHRAFPEEFWRTAASCAWQQCWIGSSSSHISGVIGTRP